MLHRENSNYRLLHYTLKYALCLCACASVWVMMIQRVMLPPNDWWCFSKRRREKWWQVATSLTLLSPHCLSFCVCCFISPSHLSIFTLKLLGFSHFSECILIFMRYIWLYMENWLDGVVSSVVGCYLHWKHIHIWSHQTELGSQRSEPQSSAGEDSHLNTGSLYRANYMCLSLVQSVLMPGSQISENSMGCFLFCWVVVITVVITVCYSGMDMQPVK